MIGIIIIMNVIVIHSINSTSITSIIVIASIINGLVVAEVLREVLLHLAEDAGDLAALRRVALHARDGEEGGGALGLGDSRSSSSR